MKYTIECVDGIVMSLECEKLPDINFNGTALVINSKSGKTIVNTTNIIRITEEEVTK